MTTIIQSVKTRNIKQQVRRFEAAAKKVASFKKSARRFLVAAGINYANGQLKPAFR